MPAWTKSIPSAQGGLHLSPAQASHKSLHSFASNPRSSQHRACLEQRSSAQAAQRCDCGYLAQDNREACLQLLKQQPLEPVVDVEHPWHRHARHKAWLHAVVVRAQLLNERHLLQGQGGIGGVSAWVLTSQAALSAGVQPDGHAPAASPGVWLLLQRKQHTSISCSHACLYSRAASPAHRCAPPPCGAPSWPSLQKKGKRVLGGTGGGAVAVGMEGGEHACKA